LKGKDVILYEIKDKKNSFTASFLNVGAAINQVRVPNKDGDMIDIHYGRDSLQELKELPGYQGCIVGRVASLIAFGRYELDGELVELSKNMAKVHSQHGGFEAFNQKIWECLAFEEEDNSVLLKFRYISPDGEEGFPGRLETIISYRIRPMSISWEIHGKTNKTTIVNMTNHAYWNLDGIFQRIDNLSLEINAEKYLEIHNVKIVLKTIAELLRLGKRTHAPMEIKPIAEFGIDLTSKKQLSTIFSEFGDLDHNFITDPENKGEIKEVARLFSEKNDLVMHVSTTEPGMVVYSGNDMDSMKSFGKQLKEHFGICIETMKPTNSIQIPKLKDWVVLRPNEEYKTKTIIDFSHET